MTASALLAVKISPLANVAIPGPRGIFRPESNEQLPKELIMKVLLILAVFILAIPVISGAPAITGGVSAQDAKKPAEVIILGKDHKKAAA